MKYVLSILIVFLFCLSVHAQREEVLGAQLKYCAPKFCLNIKADKMNKSPLDNIFSFGRSRAVFIDLKGEMFGELPVSSGYFDPKLNYIILRGIRGKGFEELGIDLTRGKIGRF